MKCILFKKLRSRMCEYEVTQQDIADELNISLSAIGTRFRGTQEFDLNQMYKICELLDIDQRFMFKYFPCGGIEKTEKKCKTA